jgi:hypothetical protein
MKNSGRLSLLILVLGLFLFLGILFRSYLLDYLVFPVAILFWYLWRILSSFDQAFYWGALVISALLYSFFIVLFRWLRRPVTLEQIPPPNSNATLENVRYWRTTILVTQDEMDNPNILKRNLGKMLASICVSKEPGSSSQEVYKALRLLNRSLPEQMDSELQGISLPKSMHAFLFPEESDARTGHSIGNTLQAVRQAPRNLMRRLTGRDVADYYQSIEEVIELMESSMEINHDQDTSDTSDH